MSCAPQEVRALWLPYASLVRRFLEVAWKDTIRLRVLRVDHDAKQIVGEFAGEGGVDYGAVSGQELNLGKP